MRNAVELAVDQQNASGGVLGAKVAEVGTDDKADAETGKEPLRRFATTIKSSV